MSQVGDFMALIEFGLQSYQAINRGSSPSNFERVPLNVSRLDDEGWEKSDWEDHQSIARRYKTRGGSPRFSNLAVLSDETAAAVGKGVWCLERPAAALLEICELLDGCMIWQMVNRI